MRNLRLTDLKLDRWRLSHHVWLPGGYFWGLREILPILQRLQHLS